MDGLPRDLVLHNLLPRLDHNSRLRLAAVSKHWRFLSQLVPLPSVAKMPWICGFSGIQDAPSLYDLKNGLRSPTKHFPRSSEIIHPFHIEHFPRFSEIAHTHHIAGAFDGNMILYKPHPQLGIRIILYNPFSGQTSQIIPHPAGPYPLFFKMKIARILPGLGLVAATDCDGQLYICRRGHYGWVKLGLIGVRDFCFYRGELFVIMDYGFIFSYDTERQLLSAPLNPFTKAEVVYTPRDDFQYPVNLQLPTNRFNYNVHHFVEFGGELLIWSRQNSGNDVKFILRKIDFGNVRLEPSPSDMRFRYIPLVPVIDLGNTMLFVGEASSSLSWTGRVDDKTGFFTQNCIYFFYDGDATNGYRFGKCTMEGMGTGTNFAEFHPERIKTNHVPLWISPHLNLFQSVKC